MAIPVEALEQFVRFSGETEGAAFGRVKQAMEWLAGTDHGAAQLERSSKNGIEFGVRNLIQERRDAGESMDFAQIRREIHDLRKEALAQGLNKVEVHTGDLPFAYHEQFHVITVPANGLENLERLGEDGKPITSTLEATLSHELDHAGRGAAIRRSDKRFSSMITKQYSKVLEPVLAFKPEHLNTQIAQAVIDGNESAAHAITLNTFDKLIEPMLNSAKPIMEAAYADVTKYGSVVKVVGQCRILGHDEQRFL